jgi:hypothetical protein
MSRALAGSIVGAVIGFVAGYVGVAVTVGPNPPSDISGMVLILGSFLAAAGAIAGAVIGGFAELRESCKKKDQTSDRDELR